MFYKMNMSHIHLCIFCVICLIFISKWDPFRNKSYKRETILKINRYLFTFLTMSSEHYSLACGCMYNACHFWVWLGKKRKKKGNPWIRTHANLHTVFPRYTLSPSRPQIEACYFNVKKNRLISVCLIYVTKHDQT